MLNLQEPALKIQLLRLQVSKMLILEKLFSVKRISLVPTFPIQIFQVPI